MCGRFAFDVEAPVFQKRFHVPRMEIQIAPHYNVSPGILLPAVIHSTLNEAVLMKWGLIPYWSLEYAVKFSNINARAETIITSPAYRLPFQKHRCLIPATGFYEWARHEDQTKTPYFFSLKSSPVFSFAGIWDVWKDAEGKRFLTCAIVTCPANTTVGNVHDRMPVILPEKMEEEWLNDTHDSSFLTTLLRPYDDTDIRAIRVSLKVNNPENDDVSLIKPEQ